MLWTKHAQQRAQQRFSTVNLEELYQRARRVTPKVRRRLLETCPGSRAMMKAEEGTGGCFYLRAPGNIIFVMRAPETVITVFKLEK